MDDNHLNYITKLKNQETLVGQKYCMPSTFLPSAYDGLLNENMFKLFTSLRWQWQKYTYRKLGCPKKKSNKEILLYGSSWLGLMTII